ncbi:MAG: glycosyltransferase family 4 protein [Candidatus Doudnabacteria bacterium]|nr:glycosyltransferase family 4 protein [Candidatus Doudnabacteria bacterium]
MLIGIEAERANHKIRTGVEHYAKQLILHLAEIDAQNQYVLFLRTSPQAWFFDLPSNFKVKVMPFPFFWTQLRISWEMLAHPVDALMVPASALPIIHPKCSVVTVHDIGWRYFPKSFTWFMRNFLEWSTGFAVRSAAKVIAVSENTKKDIVKFYKIDQSKITVIHHGYENMEHGTWNMEHGAGEKLPEKYILFLSTLQPRKNLEGLIDAFKLLKQEHPEVEHKLVVAGKPGWKYHGILQKIRANKDLVVYMNHISDEARWKTLLGADILVLPSFYEGFGMPILEAFSANVPVAASKVSSLPEVAGDAAVYFDPWDVKDIKRAISSILFDKQFLENLKTKGKERLRAFSWAKCAKETLSIIEHAT